MLIYIYNNAMRSCNESKTLHCVESYLYYIILVNKKIFSEESITSKARTFVVLQLVTNFALIEYTKHFLYIQTAKIVRAERNSILQPLLIC
jgi:hypothetical protein